MNLLNDFSTSVKKALDEIDPQWEKYEGLIICGTHTPKDWETQIGFIRMARESNIPFLGIFSFHCVLSKTY